MCGDNYKLKHSFLSDWSQRAILNEQSSNWSHVSSNISLHSTWRPLFFSVYINDLIRGVNSVTKLFSDDILFFPFVDDSKPIAMSLNESFSKRTQWSGQWKMLFNSIIALLIA